MNSPRRVALPAEAAAQVVPRPAATTLLLRDGPGGLEVLMVRRAHTVAFMPGAFVFPGGAVEPPDGAPENLACCDESHEQLAARLGGVTGLGEAAAPYAVAALRECFEEAGLWPGLADGQRPAMPWPLLRTRLHAGQPMHAIAAAAGLPLGTAALQPWSRWLTPVGLSRRFDTLFFVARMPQDQVATPDAGETSTLAWIGPQQALRAHGDGMFPMEFATISTIQGLCRFGDAAAALRHAATQGPLTLIAPRLRLDADRNILGALLPGDEGFDDA